MRNACLSLALCLVTLLPDAIAHGNAQTLLSQNLPFQIVTQNLPVPVAGQQYRVQLKVVGGQPPYHWSILGNPLPDGLRLDPQRGVILGKPVSSTEFSVQVQVADSSEPPLVITKLLVASATAPLTVTWAAAPQVAQSNIVGAVRVSNGSKDTMDMTVIVMAVNEVGKAFALRYEKLNLAAGMDSPDLKFDVFVPSGQYVVHADAVGEVADKNAIYRDRRQVDGLAVQ
jgi:hypothetical protein